MNNRFDDVLERVFRLPEYDGINKVIPLSQAIRDYVKPGMTLHIGRGVGAAVCELVRQFYGQKPAFTLAMSCPWDHVPSLIHCGMVSKLVASNCGVHNTSPGPNPIIQRAFKDKSVLFENWSLLTHVLMLMAGAMGIGFFPTRSIIGSTMAEDNKDSFKVIDDPFGSSKKIGLVKAINPDISIIHALAADPNGNLFLPRAEAETIWGAKASRGGVIATVEQIVSTDFIRENSPMVRIPSYMVNSVSVAAFGAHPASLPVGPAKQLAGYAEDHGFLAVQNSAAKMVETYDAWLKEWVLDCGDHDDYLRKLGGGRLAELRGKTTPDSWERDLAGLTDSMNATDECNTTEFMVVAAAREMARRVKRSGLRTILSGIGVSALASWVAYYLLRKEGYDAELVVGFGFYGFAPRPANPAVDAFHHITTSKILLDTFESYSVYVGSDFNKCLGAVGAGQIDKWGNINSTRIGEYFLAGSGGGNDLASTAQEVVAVVAQSPRRFVDEVSYVTCPGNRIGALVSDMGVFEKAGDEFVLTRYFPTPQISAREDAIRAVKEKCGWELKVSDNVVESARPTIEELKIVRLLDPRQEFTAP
ncbi:MAG: hypothetical protein HYX92_06325 [Chloroflexi bacterium]|nr:hypothetical protein [Chloroflexota bacterium]